MPARQHAHAMQNGKTSKIEEYYRQTLCALDRHVAARKPRAAEAVVAA